jgi:prefoldin subunit 5
MPHSIRIAFLFVLLCLANLTAAEPEPTLPTTAELRLRRETIYAELDRNVEEVKRCFELLDTTKGEDLEARQFLDSQIQQFDDRSNALHDELEEIERFEFLANRRRELVDQVMRLQNEAEQLQKKGHQVPARLRMAKAKSIQQTLDDGTWKILANDHWCRDDEPSDVISVLQLNIEVESLKQETTQLRQEVNSLRQTVQRLEELIHHRAGSK